MLTDFHIHSNFSDGKHAIPEIVDFYGKRGFGAIAITDHLCESQTFLGKAASYLDRTLTPANFPIYLEILKSEAARAWEQYRMVVIPGVEITKNSISNHRSAHVIGLGINEFTSADGDIKNTLIQLKAQGALTVAAHPLSTHKIEKQTLHLWNRRKELEPYFDAWEVGSGTHFFQEVAESGLPMLATTDLHRFSQINGWKTIVESEPNVEAIFEAIRKQEVSFHYYEERNDFSPIPFNVHFIRRPDGLRDLDLISEA